MNFDSMSFVSKKKYDVKECRFAFGLSLKCKEVKFLLQRVGKSPIKRENDGLWRERDRDRDMGRRAGRETERERERGEKRQTLYRHYTDRKTRKGERQTEAR